MPEPTTRDEHVARAQELAEAAYAVHMDLTEAAEILKANPGRIVRAHEAEHFRHAASASIAHMHGLAALATANAQIAEVLGQQPAEDPLLGDSFTVGNLGWTRDDRGWSTFGGRVEHRTPPGRVDGWYLVRASRSPDAVLLPNARSERDALAHATGVLTLGMEGYTDVDCPGCGAQVPYGKRLVCRACGLDAPGRAGDRS